jgi:hypothetical protein
MTARFERLSIVDGTILAFMLAVMAVFSFPTSADASVQNKTTLILEIKNFATIKIPEIPHIQAIADMNRNSEKVEIVAEPALEMVPTPAPIPTPVLAEAIPAALKTTIASNSNFQVPPKKIGAERVYMHEPQIRAYVCPKLGDKCNTFIAILKAENGTHECTRDNRGLNRNGTIDIGLTQINWSPSSPYTFEQLQDCKFNLDIALQKYAKRGFQPWAAYNSGRYLRHLPAVLASAKAIEASAIKTEPTAIVVVN